LRTTRPLAAKMRYAAMKAMTLKPERAGDSLTLAIGPRPNWLGVLGGILVASILWGVGVAPACDGLKVSLRRGGSLGGYILGIIACLVLILVIVYGLLDNLFGTESVTVSPTDLTIRWLICGIMRSQRELPNSTVGTLRYERWPGGRGAGMQNGIRFDCVGETVTFAQNLPESDSYELIDQMRRVYPFPVPNAPEEASSPAVTQS
jgi:hypothetical protein